MKKNCIERAQLRGHLLLLLLLQLWGLLLANAQASEREEWRNHMQPISPRGYLCQFTATPIQVDGKLDEPGWEKAPWTEDFVDIQGPAKPKPRFRTRAKLLWDEEYLYIAAELQEPHAWATLTNHDAVIFQDPDFEVFIDPDGDTHQYYEFEMNALNTGWDLRLDKPYQDQGKPHNEWEIPGLKTAVQVRGTLNEPGDQDQGWVVEIAFPWKVLSEYARHAGPPAEGEQWRIDFSRVEWEITTNGNTYQKVPNRPEDNWVWSPQGVIDMHRPEMWGILQFTRQTPTSAAVVTPLPGKAARDTALEIYYAQRDFWKAHSRWATNLAELEWEVAQQPAGVETPVLEVSPDGYVCSVASKGTEQRHIWRIRQDRLLKLDEPMPLETETFVDTAGKRFGDSGRRAAWFLVDNMPARDRGTLTSEFLLENLELAINARRTFPWAKSVPENLFLNDVLPYATLDEPRDPWRADFYKLAGEIVRDCKTGSEAAQALNRELFNRLKVHYNLGRKRNNQSPKESLEQGKATCTGLSIILVDACRAVGVPARIAGVPEWAHKQGNHTWVEIWDGEWFFMGADEYDKNGLNRGWFKNDAARTARSSDPLNQVYASSWRRTGEYFPLAWDNDSHDVAGVNVSARYAALSPDSKTNAQVIHVRLRERAEGERLSAQVEMRSENGAVLARDRTRAGTADLNDMPEFPLPEGNANVVFRFTVGTEVREKAVSCAVCARSRTLDFDWGELAPVSARVLEAETWLSQPPAERGPIPTGELSRTEARGLAGCAWESVRRTRTASANDELSAKSISLGDKTLKWMEKTFGDGPEGKRSLWITLHGGGQGTAAQNDMNWKGYFGRYELPSGSINVAPRAPANSWDLWHLPCVDDLLDRLIADMILLRGVDPNRVYIIGYSAGGDGVYQLAPRLADRFAAATMCAGHPNDATPEGLRNLPFFLYMGGEDSAYRRNEVVREFSARMDALQTADPAGYSHRLTVYPGFGHNMQNRESEVIPRMAALQRSCWPKRVVWKRSGRAPHNRFYWLAGSSESIRAGETYCANVDGQTITIETPLSGSLTLRLSDELLDLDKPVRVVAAGRTVFEGKSARSLAAIMQSFQEREDPASVATALVPVSW